MLPAYRLSCLAASVTHSLVDSSQFLDLDRNLLWFDFLSFGDEKLQDAMLENRLDLLYVHHSRQREGTSHLTRIELPAYVQLLLRFLLLLLDGGNGQRVTNCGDVQLFQLKAWQSRLNHIVQLIC